MHSTAAGKNVGILFKAIYFIAGFLCFLFIIAPSLLLILAAFSEAQYFSFPPTGFSLQWFQEMVQHQGYKSSVVRSIQVSTVAMIVSVAFALPAALAVKKRVNKTVEAFVLAPLFFPTIIWAIGLLQFYGMLGFSRSVFSIILAHTVMIMPFVFRIILQSMREMSGWLEEAAHSLGASKWRTFWQVTLPIVRPGIIVGAIFGFLVSFTDVTLTMFIAGSGEATFPVRVYSEQIQGLNPIILAWSVVFTVIIFVMSFIGEKAAKWSRFF